MPLELQTALISAGVGVVTAVIGFFITWNQIQREKTKWLTDLKTSYSIELYKLRLTSYPRMFEILGKLSKHATEPLMPEKANRIADEIHEWLYSPGGLCANATTRGALKELRTICSTWKQDERPPKMGEWRHCAMFLLRRDLDLRGFESFDLEDTESLLQMVQAEMDAAIAEAKRGART
jgi:hypothetical protein